MKGQKGFSVVILLLGLIIAILIVFVGYYVYNQQSQKQKTSETISVTAQQTNNLTEFCSVILNSCITYPKSWGDPVTKYEQSDGIETKTITSPNGSTILFATLDGFGGGPCIPEEWPIDKYYTDILSVEPFSGVSNGYIVNMRSVDVDNKTSNESISLISTTTPVKPGKITKCDKALGLGIGFDNQKGNGSIILNAVIMNDKDKTDLYNVIKSFRFK